MSSKGTTKSAVRCLIKSNIKALSVSPKDGSKTVGLMFTRLGALQFARNLLTLALDDDVANRIFITAHKRTARVSILARLKKKEKA